MAQDSACGNLTDARKLAQSFCPSKIGTLSAPETCTFYSATPWGWPHLQCLEEPGPTGGGRGSAPPLGVLGSSATLTEATYLRGNRLYEAAVQAPIRALAQ